MYARFFYFRKGTVEVACIKDIIWPWLVTSAKQRQYPCSGFQQNQRITRNSFEFPLNLNGKLTMAFLTSQSWHVLKYWCRNGWGLSSTDVPVLLLNKPIVFSVNPVRSCKSWVAGVHSMTRDPIDKKCCFL